ncbi:MAG: molybdopterin dinucleotide binding domain protein [Methanosaeta sp. PtaB.Bin018]|nr:MAG: molybdopterin dinucleotide binding domain protein [Methanosaeta sp. PtaB.Bin018]OPY43151.1 MAG: molybdopterin dinucleotide binding domain protein [Methanosaeta sp. PtaU1.Bin016]
METAVTIVTFRDIFQDEAAKKSKFTDEFRDLCARILLDKQDMASLGLKDGQKVRVQSEVGAVIVVAKTSDDDPHPRLAFMTFSPWSNQLAGEDACMSGARIAAKLSPSDESVTQISELLQRMRAQGIST